MQTIYLFIIVVYRAENTTTGYDETTHETTHEFTRLGNVHRQCICFILNLIVRPLKQALHKLLELKMEI